MRELIFKNLYSSKSKKREVCIEETVTRGNCTSQTIKRSLYFLRSIATINSQTDYDKWLKEKEANDKVERRNFHIMKIHSDSEGSDTVLCKAMGMFYIANGKEIYNIVFMHSLRMKVTNSKHEEVK